MPTIGYGTILYSNGTTVTMDDNPISQSQAIDELEYNINLKCNSINDLVTVEINQHQFDALASFTYNLGVHALTSSTLLKLLNNSDFDGAAEQFLVWDKVGGKVIQGLLNRRMAEKALFLLGC